VCALDTELLGHWWYEGVAWLNAVLDECARQDVPLTTLDDALERHEPVPAGVELGITSWGAGADLRTWSGPAVADLAWQARSLELRLLAFAGQPGERALRELLALQSSDWAFIATNDLAGPYPHERVAGHAAALERAISGDYDGEPTLRNLAPDLTGWRG
jgi:1,4-alpha-glucan branching enzyme